MTYKSFRSTLKADRVVDRGCYPTADEIEIYDQLFYSPISEHEGAAVSQLSFAKHVEVTPMTLNS